MKILKLEKKDKTKRLRKDKEKVLDQLFNAFTQHQYYNIKDLVKLTQQPPVNLLIEVMVNGIIYLNFFFFVWLLELLKGHSTRDLSIQRQRCTQKHVGAKGRVQTGKREFRTEQESSCGFSGQRERRRRAEQRRAHGRRGRGQRGL